MKIIDIIDETNTANANIKSSSGSEYSRDELYALAELIAQGGEVSSELVLRNLESSPLIVSAFVDGTAVGVVALKIPNTSYKQKVFQNSNSQQLLNSFTLEVGYAYVNPNMRSHGVGTQLLRTMRAKMPAGVFATTRENNTTINTILKFAGFHETGNKYPSARGDYHLILWTK